MIAIGIGLSLALLFVAGAVHPRTRRLFVVDKDPPKELPPADTDMQKLEEWKRIFRETVIAIDGSLSPELEKFLMGDDERVEKLGGYSPNPLRGAVEAVLLLRLCELRREHPDLTCISGMAIGFDQWLAEACAREGIPFEAAVPFSGQEKRWPLEAQRRYRELLAAATRVHIVSQNAHSNAFELRNRYMVDSCNHLIAAWNGSPGGTANCWRYAGKVGRLRENLLDTESFLALKRDRRW